VVAIGVLGKPPGVGAPSATPSVVPTLTPVASPSPSSLPLLSGATVGPDGLPPGTYLIDRPFPIRLALTLPPGWDEWQVTEDAAGILAWTDDVHGSGWPISFWIIAKVALDPESDIRCAS
jgi:hypothetical protein